MQSHSAAFLLGTIKNSHYLLRVIFQHAVELEKLRTHLETSSRNATRLTWWFVVRSNASTVSIYCRMEQMGLPNESITALGPLPFQDSLVLPSKLVFPFQSRGQLFCNLIEVDCFRINLLGPLIINSSENVPLLSHLLSIGTVYKDNKTFFDWRLT